MKVKVLDQAQAQVKAATTKVGERTLDFYAAAFSATPDLNGDIIDPHALDEWLQAFYKAGKSLPISFAHAAVRDDMDPFRIFGHAPADADHVWVDDYGLRVKALLDMENPNARQVAMLIDNNTVSGASIAYAAIREKRKSGGHLITKMEVFEAGPCLSPANSDAVVLGLKSAQAALDLAEKVIEGEASFAVEGGLLSVEGGGLEVELKVVDTSTWQGGKAMAECSSAADYGSICAGERTVGTPDERQHWVLPHHYLGKGPNANGVAAARGRLDQTENLSNDAEARSHLEAHQKEIEAATATKTAEVDSLGVDDGLEAITKWLDVREVELKHGAAPVHLQTAHNALVRAGAKCSPAEPTTKTATDPDEVQARLRRLRLIRLSIT